MLCCVALTRHDHNGASSRELVCIVCYRSMGVPNPLPLCMGTCTLGLRITPYTQPCVTFTAGQRQILRSLFVDLEKFSWTGELHPLQYCDCTYTQWPWRRYTHRPGRPWPPNITSCGLLDTRQGLTKVKLSR